ncbi:hypothetical protein [Nonomuraea dietziae]|uniref:hypothetical protein n=1 Tax=Nonomuraea dietziae TaxID=65515 RepID=UPI0033EEA9C6
MQRKVVSPNDFTGLDQVDNRLIATRPFRWKFTPVDLEDLLAGIERQEQKERDPQQPTDCKHPPAALAPAA